MVGCRAWWPGSARAPINYRQEDAPFRSTLLVRSPKSRADSRSTPFRSRAVTSGSRPRGGRHARRLSVCRPSPEAPPRMLDVPAACFRAGHPHPRLERLRHGLRHWTDDDHERCRSRRATSIDLRGAAYRYGHRVRAAGQSRTPPAGRSRAETAPSASRPTFAWFVSQMGVFDSAARSSMGRPRLRSCTSPAALSVRPQLRGYSG